MIVLAIVLGAAGITSQTDIVQNQVEKIQDGPADPSIRELETNPGKYENKTVKISGQAGFTGESIQSEGYDVGLDCQKYEYDWGSWENTEITGNVTIDSEGYPTVHCIEPPRRVE